MVRGPAGEHFSRFRRSVFDLMARTETLWPAVTYGDRLRDLCVNRRIPSSSWSDRCVAVIHCRHSRRRRRLDDVRFSFEIRGFKGRLKLTLITPTALSRRGLSQADVEPPVLAARQRSLVSGEFKGAAINVAESTPSLRDLHAGTSNTPVFEHSRAQLGPSSAGGAPDERAAAASSR